MAKLTWNFQFSCLQLCLLFPGLQICDTMFHFYIARNWTQDLTYIRQAPYQLSCISWLRGHHFPFPRLSTPNNPTVPNKFFYRDQALELALDNSTNSPGRTLVEPSSPVPPTSSTMSFFEVTNMPTCPTPYKISNTPPRLLAQSVLFKAPCKHSLCSSCPCLPRAVLHCWPAGVGLPFCPHVMINFMLLISGFLLISFIRHSFFIY